MHMWSTLIFLNGISCICFLVLADHYEAWSDRSPAVLIEFYNVREFSCRMPQPEIGFDEPEKHLQWKIDDFEIQVSNAITRLRLFGSPSSPVLNIECEGIEIRSIAGFLLDKTFPGWNKPFAGLVRQSVEDMANGRK